MEKYIQYYCSSAGALNIFQTLYPLYKYYNF